VTVIGTQLNSGASSSSLTLVVVVVIVEVVVVTLMVIVVLVAAGHAEQNLFAAQYAIYLQHCSSQHVSVLGHDPFGQCCSVLGSKQLLLPAHGCVPVGQQPVEKQVSPAAHHLSAMLGHGTVHFLVLVGLERYMAFLRYPGSTHCLACHLAKGVFEPSSPSVADEFPIRVMRLLENKFERSKSGTTSRSTGRRNKKNVVRQHATFMFALVN
jgi:hypothetical protein